MTDRREPMNQPAGESGETDPASRTDAETGSVAGAIAGGGAAGPLGGMVGGVEGGEAAEDIDHPEARGDGDEPAGNWPRERS